MVYRSLLLEALGPMSSYMLETNSPWILIGFFLGEAEKRKLVGWTKVPTAAADIIISLHHPFWIPPTLNYQFCWVLTGSVIRLLSLRDLRSKLQSFLFFLISLFISLWLCWVFIAVRGLFSSCRAQTGFSLWGPFLLWSTASRVCRLQ